MFYLLDFLASLLPVFIVSRMINFIYGKWFRKNLYIYSHLTSFVICGILRALWTMGDISYFVESVPLAFVMTAIAQVLCYGYDTNKTRLKDNRSTWIFVICIAASFISLVVVQLKRSEAAGTFIGFEYVRAKVLPQYCMSIDSENDMSNYMHIFNEENVRAKIKAYGIMNKYGVKFRDIAAEMDADAQATRKEVFENLKEEEGLEDDIEVCDLLNSEYDAAYEEISFKEFFPDRNYILIN